MPANKSRPKPCALSSRKAAGMAEHVGMIGHRELGSSVRDRWCIEGWHWMRDTLLHEDVTGQLRQSDRYAADSYPNLASGG
jgi:hypothetical protein